MARIGQGAEPVKMVPDLGKRVRQMVKCLEKLPEDPHRDDALMDKARMAVRGLLGDVTVVEEEKGVFAQVQLAQVCISHGAEKRT